jgi:hypothetical protein
MPAPAGTHYYAVRRAILSYKTVAKSCPVSDSARMPSSIKLRTRNLKPEDESFIETVIPLTTR